MKKYYSMETNGRAADIYIFGDIVDAINTGFDEAWDLDIGEVSGLSIVKEIKGLDADVINVHINSCGGYTNEGLAIYNSLKNHSAKVNTFCDGFACSAASLVFMAGDSRIMNAASALMIHNAWTSGITGNGAQLRQQADMLDKISQAAGNAYAEYVNISRDKLDAMLDGDNHEGTWILPDDAVKMGFATEISKAAKSSVANQSAMEQILQKVTAKPQSTIKDVTVGINLDTEKFYAELEKAKGAAEQAADEIKNGFNGVIETAQKTTNAERIKMLLGKKV